MTTDLNKHIALREAECISALDAYFKPRPVEDGAMSRRAFEAGFERGFDAGGRAYAASTSSPYASPAAAAVAGAPVAWRRWQAFDDNTSGWVYYEQKVYDDAQPLYAAPHPSPSAAEQADDTLRWRLSTIAAECDDPDTTDALDKLLEELPLGSGDGPVYAAVSAAAEQAGRWVPVARVADVHMSRYTIEWLDRPMPEGTVLFADIIEWAANAPRRRREAAAAPSASPAEAPAEMPYGFESGLVQLLNEARCLSKETVGNRELASRIIRYMRMHDPQPVAPAGQAAAVVQGELHCGPCESRCADCPIDWSRFPAPAVERGVAEERERAFAEWLNDQRDKPVAEVFHDIVDRYRVALSTAGKEQAATQETPDEHR